MSQDTFPFAEGSDTAAFADEAEPERNRKAVIAAGGVAAALVLAAAGYFFLGGSGDGAVDSAFVPGRVAHPAVAAPKSATKPAKKLPAPYKEQLGRDPFKALYVLPAVAQAGPGVTATGTTAPGVTPAVSGTGTVPTTGGGTTPTTTANKEYKLILMRVYGTGTDRTAVFSIDGKQQVAKIGTKFGPTSEIVLLSMQQGPKAGQWTSVLQVGDGDPFDVVTGAPAYVR
jgi:hypothetical protein